MTARDLAAMKRLEKWREVNPRRWYRIYSPLEQHTRKWAVTIIRDITGSTFEAPTLAEAVDKALGKKGKGK